MRINELVTEEKAVGKFTKEYEVSLNDQQKAAILRALEWTIKTYLADGYDVTLRTAKDTERGISVLLYAKKGNEMSSLVAHKSVGPAGKLVDLLNK